MNIAFDANIWISFTIGKRLAVLKDILLNPALQPQFTVYYCPGIVAEYRLVVKRPKLRKYVTPERITETLDLIARIGEEIAVTQTVIGSRDPKDNYLLALAQQVPLDYLITGDRDLLVLQRWQQTELISFGRFEEIIAGLHS